MCMRIVHIHWCMYVCLHGRMSGTYFWMRDFACVCLIIVHLCTNTHTHTHSSVCRYLYVKAVCVFVYERKSTQDYRGLIPHSSPGPDPFKQHSIFLWESLHASPSIFLSFSSSISFSISVSFSLTPNHSGMEGEIERCTEKAIQREMILSFSTFFLFHQAYI